MPCTENSEYFHRYNIQAHGIVKNRRCCVIIIQSLLLMEKLIKLSFSLFSFIKWLINEQFTNTSNTYRFQYEINLVL